MKNTAGICHFPSRLCDIAAGVCSASPPVLFLFQQWYLFNLFFQRKRKIFTWQIKQSRGHYGEVTKRCWSFFFVRPVTWAPPAITGLKIETRTGLRRNFCQYMGLLAPAMMTAHEAAWNLPGLPSYHPAPKADHIIVSPPTRFSTLISKKQELTRALFPQATQGISCATTRWWRWSKE